MPDDEQPKFRLPRAEWPEEGGPTFRFARPNVVTKSFGRRAPKGRFSDPEDPRNSVYYYWWKYLRFHKGYQQTCLEGGGGPYGSIYEDFGDIFTTDFITWWELNGNDLFAEPRVGRAEIVDYDEISQLNLDEHIIIAVPTKRKYHTVMRHIGKELKAALKEANDGRSRAKYKVIGKPQLIPLHTHLRVWRLWNASLDENGKSRLWLYEIAERAGLKVQDGLSDEERRRALSNLARRHIRKALACIESAATNEFPRLG